MKTEQVIQKKSFLTWDDKAQAMKIHIATSDTFSLLIKEAAKCEKYASDVIYDICSIKEYLEGIQFEPRKEWLLGFRELGVDGTSFVECRGIGNVEYREVFQLVVEIKSDDSVTMTLNRVVRGELCK